MAAMIFLRSDTGARSPLPAPWDKVAHFLYYGSMTLLLAHCVGRRGLWIPMVLVPLIAAADESHQMGVLGRDAAALDWMADVSETVAFAYAYYRATNRGAEGRELRIRDERAVAGGAVTKVTRDGLNFSPQMKNIPLVSGLRPVVGTRATAGSRSCLSDEISRMAKNNRVRECSMHAPAKARLHARTMTISFVHGTFCAGWPGQVGKFDPRFSD